ncbi:MAG: hypothetical protein U1D31_03510 [Patescibacteria group bacterium]|nr:hypothetical protein [bacterium]MDZ4241159.1 hypothetical protein [Patescibacteria group bacterium]
MLTIGEIITDIRKARIREREKFDKLLVTFSAGTFVLSITFVTGIVNIGLSNILILFISWSLLLLSIFSIIIAYILADWHFSRKEEDVRSLRNYNGAWGKIADWLTIGSAIFLMIGILFLCIFAVVNVLKFNKFQSQTTAIQENFLIVESLPERSNTPNLYPL